jgi:hypothetical protein
MASDRTYGARHIWRDLLAAGVECGVHPIERLMRLQPQRRPKDNCESLDHSGPVEHSGAAVCS